MKLPPHLKVLILSRASKGFTLIEVLVSLCIFSIASIAVGKSFINHLTITHTAELRGDAFVAAQQVLDGLRVQDPSTFPTTGSTGPQTVGIGGKNYSVMVYYCRVATYSSSANVRFLTVEVSYRGVVQYSVDTIYSQLR